MTTSSRQDKARRQRPDVEIDHWLYLTERRYRRQVLIALRRLNGRRKPARPLIADTLVLHESDDSCCQLEEWSLTFARILKALTEDGQAVGVVGRDGAFVVTPGSSSW